MHQPHQRSMFFKPITCKEIHDIFNNMSKESSSGLDSISVKVVKKVISLICTSLCNIFNLSLSTGTIPKYLKIAKVTPIFKRGSRDNMNNYRPISVLNIFAKILEKCVYNRIINFIDNNNIIFNNQYGFRSCPGAYT